MSAPAPQSVQSEPSGPWAGLRRLAARALSSPMLRHVAVLAGGQSFAAAIPILTAPVLGRLYAPADYGILGAYMSLAVVIASLGNWQYAQAIVLERTDRRAYALFRVCIWTSLLTAVGSLLVPLLAAPLLKDAGKLSALSLWLWLIPLSALIGGLTGALTALANRFRRYSSMATIQIAAALATAATSIALGWHGWGADGLLTGYFAGQLTTFFGYVVLIGRSAGSAVRKTAATESRALLIRHRAYALYTTPTTFIEQIASNAPVYALGAIGAPAAIGLYSRARLLLAMPLTLIGGAVAQVFQQRAAADVAARGHCREVYAKTFLTLAGLGLLPTLLLTLVAPSLFALYLGPKWREAGDVARILAPMLYLQVICSPLSRVFYLRHRQRLDFALSLGNAALVAATTGFAVWLGASPNQIIAAYAGAASVVYVAYLVIGWSLAQPAGEGSHSMSYRRMLAMKPPLLGSLVALGVRAFYKLASKLRVGQAFIETRQTQTPITLYVWFWQRIAGINAGAYWPMHPSSDVVWPEHICIGVETSPGLSPGCRLNGRNGIYIGDYTQISQNVGIISANHDPYDLPNHLPGKPIRIGRYCLLGMNAMILPEVELGDYTIVAANAVVTESYPDGYVVLAGSPAKPVRTLDRALAKNYQSPYPYHGFIRAADFEAFKARNLKLK